jgi:hypothetical protein
MQRLVQNRHGCFPVTSEPTIMDHNVLFGSMLTGSPVHVVSPDGKWFRGTVTMIEMESGPRDGYTPCMWNVRVVSDDDVVTKFVRTREMWIGGTK